MSGKFSVKYFFNFYFLNVDITFTMHDPNLKLRMCIKNIVVAEEEIYTKKKELCLRFLIEILVHFL